MLCVALIQPAPLTGCDGVVAFSSLRGFLGQGSAIHSSPMFFLLFKCRSARAHEFHSLRQYRSTVAQRAETTVAECSLTVARRLVSLIDSHTIPGQHSQPTPPSLGQGYMRVYV